MKEVERRAKRHKDGDKTGYKIQIAAFSMFFTPHFTCEFEGLRNSHREM